MNTTVSRWAAALAIAYPVCVALNIAVLNGGAPLPDPSASAAGLAAAAHDRHTGLVLGAYIDAAGSVLFAVFVVALVQAALGLRSALGFLPIIGAVLAAGADLAWAGSQIAAAELAFHGGAADAVKALLLLTNGLLVAIGVPGGIAFIGIGLALRRGAVLPVAYAWIALVLGVVNVVASAAEVFSQAAAGLTFISYLGTLLWALAAGIWLLARRRASAQEVADQAA